MSAWAERKETGDAVVEIGAGEAAAMGPDTGLEETRHATSVGAKRKAASPKAPSEPVDDGAAVHLPPVSALEADAAAAHATCWGRLRASLLYTGAELRQGDEAMKARADIEKKTKAHVNWMETVDQLSTQDPLDDAAKKARAAGWRGKLEHFLESDGLSLTVLVLIILDVVAVFGEILLNHVCDPNDKVEAVAHTLHDFSLSILFTLALQQLLLVVAEGPLNYVRNFWYVFDLLVVSASITLDLVIKSPEGGLVVLLMSWRIVRVVHGFITTVEMQRDQVHHFKKEVRRMEQRIAVLTSWRIVLLRSKRLTNRAQLIKHTVRQWQKRAREKRERRERGQGAKLQPAASTGTGSSSVALLPGQLQDV